MGLVMDELLQKNIKLIESRVEISSIAVSDRLEKIRFPFGLLQLRAYNYQAEKIRKIYFLRISTRVPALDYLGMGIYPTAKVELPFFYFDLSCTKKKTIAYINSVPLLSEEDYRQEYIEPLEPIRNQYRHLPTRKTPDWMAPYVTSQTIYSIAEKKYHADFEQCGCAYFSAYLDQYARCEIISAGERMLQIESAQRRYLDLMLENDVTQKMLGRLIGKKKANRMFREVLS